MRKKRTNLNGQENTKRKKGGASFPYILSNVDGASEEPSFDDDGIKRLSAFRESTAVHAYIFFFFGAGDAGRAAAAAPGERKSVILHFSLWQEWYVGSEATRAGFFLFSALLLSLGNDFSMVSLLTLGLLLITYGRLMLGGRERGRVVCGLQHP